MSTNSMNSREYAKAFALAKTLVISIAASEIVGKIKSEEVVYRMFDEVTAHEPEFLDVRSMPAEIEVSDGEENLNDKMFDAVSNCIDIDVLTTVIIEAYRKTCAENNIIAVDFRRNVA